MTRRTILAGLAFAAAGIGMASHAVSRGEQEPNADRRGHEQRVSPLPEEVNVQAIVDRVVSLANSRIPGSQVFAKELSRVLHKYKAKLPSVLSNVAAEPPKEQPTPDELDRLAEQTRHVVGECANVRRISPTDPPVVREFYGEFLSRVAGHCPSNAGRMAAARMLCEAAKPDYEASARPRALIDPGVASAACKAALDSTLDVSSGSFSDDSANALLASQFGEYLTVSAMSRDNDPRQFVEQRFNELLAQLEQADNAEASKVAHSAIKLWLSTYKSIDAKAASTEIAARVIERRELAALLDRLVHALNAEDRQKLAALYVPGAIPALPQDRPLRQSWSRTPNTTKVLVGGIGPIYQIGDADQRRVRVYFTYYRVNDPVLDVCRELCVSKTSGGWRFDRRSK